MRLVGGAALVAAAMFALVGCSAVPDTAPTDAAATTVESASDPTPASSPTPTTSGIDRTYEAQAAGGGIVARAVENSDGVITIYTDVASPYSEAQEASRSEAIVACEAVRASMGATAVMVLDAGERPFVIFNGSNFPDCAVK